MLTFHFLLLATVSLPIKQASLGVLWFIPSFESSPCSSNEISLLKLDASEIDFLKPQANIEAVEIGWRWVD